MVRGWKTGMLCAALAVCASASAITVKLDYTYDSTGFFDTGTTNGAAARATVEAAASYFSTILNDTFTSIQTPPPVASSVSSGLYTWSWTATFNHPSTGASVTLTDGVIPANEYRVYVGARGLGGSLGIGGPGGWGYDSNVTGSNSFTSAEINQINATNNTFGPNVENRGETSGFVRWGGALTFNNTSSWNLNHTVNPTSGQNDLLSVAIHELGHALGLGASEDWNELRSGSAFLGPAAVATFGGAISLSADLAHWQNGAISTVYGTTTTQEAAMDPDITVGTRKRFTTLDAAALTDIGWEVGPAPPMGVPGDYSGNGVVDAADYTRWRDLNGTAGTARTVTRQRAAASTPPIIPTGRIASATRAHCPRLRCSRTRNNRRRRLRLSDLACSPPLQVSLAPRSVSMPESILEVSRWVGQFFMETSPQHNAMRRLTKTLGEMDISFAIAGAMAANAHGYHRTTADVDILISRENLTRFKEAHSGRGWVDKFEGSKNFRDTVNNVNIDALIVGQYPGDGLPKPISFPDPAAVREVINEIPYISLATLLELKLACGMTAAHRMQDLADVMHLIRINSLPLDYAATLNPYVADKFRELWQSAQVVDDY